MRDPRGSRWDGHVCKVLAGSSLERSVSPGEIAVFEPTGETVAVTEETQLRSGKVKVREVEALVYRRTRTRLVSPPLKPLGAV